MMETIDPHEGAHASALHAHSTPDPDTEPSPTPPTVPVPDDVPDPAHAPVEEPTLPVAPIRAH